MKRNKPFLLLLASFLSVLSLDADQPFVEKYDRMYKQLIAMTEERGPIARLSEKERETFMVDVRKMIADVEEEVENEFVSIGGSIIQKKQAQKQLVLLSALQKTSKNLRLVLDPFEVQDVRIDFSRVERNGDPVTLHLTCHNQTDFAVSKVRVRAKVVSEGRTIPWAKDDYLIRIRGGVEAGETRRITETIQGDLSFVPAAGIELSVQVKVLELFDEKGNSVGIDKFSEKDQALLSELETVREDLFYRE